MPLSDKIRSAKKSAKKEAPATVWAGPESFLDNGGITQSLLSRFLSCRERFRLLVVEGLKPTDDFNQRIEYGNMWHVCEEALAASGNPIVDNPVAKAPWVEALTSYCRELCRKYRNQQSQVQHWYRVCLVQFPTYVRYWNRNPDVVDRHPLLQEEKFKVPYELPSGRIVWLRGKFDSVDLIGKPKDQSVWIQENKSKGDIDESQMPRQLTFDLQTMMYRIALREYDLAALEDKQLDAAVAKKGGLDRLLAGVRYNVIRRPLAGGKHSIKQKEGSAGSKCTRKSCRETPSRNCDACGGSGRVGGTPPETADEFYARLGELIKSEPAHYFMRWKVVITPSDVEQFQRECFNPILEQLCQWWEHITLATQEGLDPFGWGQYPGIHFRYPYGVYNPTLEGRSSELDEHLMTGSELGLERTDELFPELK